MADSTAPIYAGESVVFGNNPNNDRVHARIAKEKAAAAAKVTAVTAPDKGKEADAGLAANAAAATGNDPKPLATPPAYKPRS